MEIIDILNQAVIKGFTELYNVQIEANEVQLQETRKEFEGDFTFVVFPFVKQVKRSPEQLANELGNQIKINVSLVESFNVVKGFLNIKLTQQFWLSYFNQILTDHTFGLSKPGTSGKTIMVEYSSPNTNKPLHLGHIRNNLLGYSVAEILKANGHIVYKVNLVNDRGIHICKSMLAWQHWGNGITPEKAGIKGDKLVGEYYVRFDQEYKKEISSLMASGVSEDNAKENAPLIKEAREMLRKWESGDEQVISLWKTMNGWVYEGFDVTYKAMGVDFDKIYHESETYKLGKEIVLQGLDKGVLIRKEDGSIWADLTNDGLDEKLLLRSDGTSVYMTQDIGTAHQRFSEFHLDDQIYVVGNEQNYHFQVLKLVLKKLGYAWFEHITHLSYGMVELPEGKMKSREGTVVDADDLIAEMIDTARETSVELGKLDDFTHEEARGVYEMIGLGALKYFILKVDPKKTMMFNPKESIDFNGNTGSFIQYTHARIRSLARKAEADRINFLKGVNPSIRLNEKEIQLIKLLSTFPSNVKEAGNSFSPALIANFMYELAREFNQFYHDFSILKEEDQQVMQFRLLLSVKIGECLKKGMKLLGIEVPEKM